MAAGLVNVWNAARWGELSEQSVRALHEPAEWHRISRKHYPPGTRFRGTMRSGSCYVARGKCQYEFETQTFVLTAGTWAVLPGGDFTFAVLGDEEMERIVAWKLPFAVPSPTSEC